MPSDFEYGALCEMQRSAVEVVIAASEAAWTQ
jgi:hypothetical protein